MKVKTGDKIRETFHEESDDGFAENKDTVLQTVNSGQYGSCVDGNQPSYPITRMECASKEGVTVTRTKIAAIIIAQNEQADYRIYSFLGWGR